MDLDPKSCTKQILCVLAIWLLAYGALGLLLGRAEGPVMVASSQLDLRTSVLLNSMNR